MYFGFDVPFTLSLYVKNILHVFFCSVQKQPFQENNILSLKNV